MNNYIDKDWFEKIQKSTKAQVAKKNLLDKNEIPKIIAQYKQHILQQLEIENPNERILFLDQHGGTIFEVISPDAEIDDGGDIKNRPKQAKNGSWYLWGYNIPLLGEFNKIKYFSETQQGMLGYSKKALVRGAMTYKYKRSGSTDYAMFEKAFIVEMKKFYKMTNPELTIETLADIKKEDYYIDYTFNLWEVIQVL